MSGQSSLYDLHMEQAALTEHLVNIALQRRANVAMSRLRSFTIKSACDRPLHILGTTMSREFKAV